MFDKSDLITDDLPEEDITFIDSFFDALELDSVHDGKILQKELDVSKLMMKIMGSKSFSKRWAYTGSFTSPPCITNDSKVYWNVVQRVFPIKERHVQLLNDLLSSDYLKLIVEEDGEEEVSKLTNMGNNRIT